MLIYRLHKRRSDKLGALTKPVSLIESQINPFGRLISKL